MLRSDTPSAVLLPPDDTWLPMVVTSDDWPVNVWIEHQGSHVVAQPEVLLPDDGRGYELFVDDRGHYVAGCRDFATAEEAIEHWSDPDHEAPTSAALLRWAIEVHLERTQEEQ